MFDKVNCNTVKNIAKKQTVMSPPPPKNLLSAPDKQVITSPVVPLTPLRNAFTSLFLHWNHETLPCFCPFSSHTLVNC